MTGEAQERLAKAARLLEQAEPLDARQAPEAIIHLSYYAMFHAATAVLLGAGETQTLTHGGLIGGFGRIMRNRGDHDRAQARLFNRAQDLRMQSDYGVSPTDLAEGAAGLLQDAKSFVAFCSNICVTSR